MYPATTLKEGCRSYTRDVGVSAKKGADHIDIDIEVEVQVQVLLKLNQGSRVKGQGSRRRER